MVPGPGGVVSVPGGSATREWVPGPGGCPAGEGLLPGGGFFRGVVSQHALSQTPALTATVAGGTHPTGMHSCYESDFVIVNY